MLNKKSIILVGDQGVGLAVHAHLLLHSLTNKFDIVNVKDFTQDKDAFPLADLPPYPYKNREWAPLQPAHPNNTINPPQSGKEIRRQRRDAERKAKKK